MKAAARAYPRGASRPRALRAPAGRTIRRATAEPGSRPSRRHLPSALPNFAARPSRHGGLTGRVAWAARGPFRTEEFHVAREERPRPQPEGPGGEPSEHGLQDRTEPVVAEQAAGDPAAERAPDLDAAGQGQAHRPVRPEDPELSDEGGPHRGSRGRGRGRA